MFRYFLILVLFLTWTYGAPRATKKHLSIKSKDKILKRTLTSDFTIKGKCLHSSECHPKAFCDITSNTCRCGGDFYGDGITNCTSDCPQECHPEASCYLKKCTCTKNFHGDGIKECKSNCPKCHPNGYCNRNRCECIYNFYGDGIKNCTSRCPKCDEHASCDGGYNEPFKCKCDMNWHGDGIKCGPDCSLCHPKASCVEQNFGVNVKHSVCVCKDGYFGNGVDCTSENVKLLEEVSEMGKMMQQLVQGVNHVAERLGKN